jgi:DNA-binding beta-propeller fold protein YncE
MRNGTAFCLMFLLLPGVAFGQASPALQLTTRIALTNVDGRMDHMGVDLAGQRLFAAAFDNHTLQVIDLQAGRQISVIANLDEPQAAYYDPATKRLFVTSGGDGTVKIFDGGTLRLLQTVKLTADVDNVRYDARGKHVIVGYGGEKSLYGQATRQQGDGALAILDLAGKKVMEIPTDAHPESFQLEQTGTRVFINVPDKKEIQVSDLASGKTLAHWPLATCVDNFPMTLDEAHHRLMVACRGPSNLLVLDTQTGKPVASVPLDSGLFSDDLFYDQSKSRIYVVGRTTGADPRALAPGLVEIFQQKDSDHYEKVGTVPTGWGAQTGFFVPAQGKLYVATRRQQGGPGGEILVFETK